MIARRGLDAVELGHADVEQRDVGLESLAAEHRLVAVLGLGDDLDLRLGLQHHPQAGSHERLVVGEQDPDRRHVAPPPRAGRLHPESAVGPLADARAFADTVAGSRSRASPYPEGGALLVGRRDRRRRPRTSTRVGRYRTCTLTRASAACFTTLVSASCAIRYADMSTPDATVAARR